MLVKILKQVLNNEFSPIEKKIIQDAIEKPRSLQET